MDSLPKPDSITVGYDATVRPWYQAVSYQTQPAWSDIYLYFAENVLGISASHPIYGVDGTFQGVLATDIQLDQLKDFLDTLAIGQNGGAFIIERAGTMVASSTPEPPFKLTDTETYTQERLLALDSEEALISRGAKALVDQFGSLDQVAVPEAGSIQPFELMIDNERYFMQVLPFNHGQHLDWLIVVIAPESDFIGEIRAAGQHIIVTGMVALAIALIFGIGFLRWVTLPL
ncbi:MAG: hybrid sensor histidine kinase/response regulator, partial [Merismopedia sp. SIO2A8]|nr:hybrid sensor histidine kinase/response regulator [Merismopedia sp. SIO2A8]